MATLSLPRLGTDGADPGNFNRTGWRKKRHEKAILLLESRQAVPDGRGGFIAPPLMSVGDRSLLRHQLDQLTRLGITEVIAVTGRASEDMLDAIGGRARVLYDARWPVTDAIEALTLCEPYVDGPVLILDGSTMAEDRVLMRLLDAPGNAMAWDGPDELEEPSLLAARIEPRLVFQILEMASSCYDGARPFRRLQAALRARSSVGLLDLVDVTDLVWGRVQDRTSLRQTRRAVWPRIVARPRVSQRMLCATA